MDKTNNVRIFKADFVRITVSKGSITRCYYFNKIVIPSNTDFRQILECAMREMASKAPHKFEEMYKSLFLSTAEYKMAKRIYKEFKVKGRA